MTNAVRTAIEALPGKAVADILSIGVCPICALRFFGVRSGVYLEPSFARVFIRTHAQLNCESRDDDDKQSSAPSDEQTNDQTLYQNTDNPCITCLGIFQCSEFTTECTPAMVSLEKKERAFFSCKTDIVNAVKRAGYQFDSFSLEITLPGIVSVRERAVWQYLQEKHGLQIGLKGKQFNQHVVPLKEALRLVLVNPLEELLQAVYNTGSTFKIILLYKHAETVSELGFPGCSLKKKRKATDESSSDCTEPVESVAAIQQCLASMTCKQFSDLYSSPPPKCKDACNLDVSCHRASIFVGGRYLKFSRNVSQSPWLIDEDRKGDGSVQEIIADILFPSFNADSYKFHASGREDVDVRMLGRGRPFIVEIINAQTVLAKEDVQKLEDSINSLKEGWVKVRHLQLVGNDVRCRMLEGESEKQKQYTAVIWLSKVISDAEIDAFTVLKDLEIQQRTPVRVLHRRSSLIRPRVIHWLKLERMTGADQYFLLHLCSQAGTYIKEFVHGDLGRTHPNVGSLFGCEAEILQLDVTDIAMDLFEQ